MTPTASICACHRVALERSAGDRVEVTLGELTYSRRFCWARYYRHWESQHKPEQILDRKKTNITIVASKTILTAGELEAQCVALAINKECWMKTEQG